MRRGPARAVVTPAYGSVKLSRPLKVEAGQYINLWIPSVSFWTFLQSHPGRMRSSARWNCSWNLAGDGHGNFCRAPRPAGVAGRSILVGCCSVALMDSARRWANMKAF